MTFTSYLKAIYSLLLGIDSLDYEERLYYVSLKLLSMLNQGLQITYWNEINQMRTILVRNIKIEARCIQLQDFILEYILMMEIAS